MAERPPLSLRIFKRIPGPLKDEPFEMFSAVLCLLAGIPLIISGQVGAGDALTKAMNPLELRIWGATLSLGGLLILIGMGLASRSGPVYRTLRARTVERLGLLLLGYTVALYTVALALVGGASAMAGVLVSAAFAVSCGVRALTIVSTHRMLWKTNGGQVDGGR